MVAIGCTEQGAHAFYVTFLGSLCVCGAGSNTRILLLENDKMIAYTH